MYKYLKELSRLYSEDFDSIFESATGPIDVFRYDHNREEQKQLAGEMEMFLKEIEAGTKTESDLVKMGLGYNPSDDESWDWFREAMAHLKKKIAEG